MIIDNQRSGLKKLYQRLKKNILPENLFKLMLNLQVFSSIFHPKKQITTLKSYDRIEKVFTPFTKEEYNAYNFISSENQKHIDIEADHYFDEGCQCDYCHQVRAITIQRIKKGMKPLHKILHRLCYQK